MFPIRSGMNLNTNMNNMRIDMSYVNSNEDDYGYYSSSTSSADPSIDWNSYRVPQQCYPASCMPMNKQAMSGTISNNENSNNRKLPCRTFIAVGCCPYRDRCAYLHDPRIASHYSKSKSRKKGIEDSSPQDCFYWPAIERHDKPLLDVTGRPVVIQQYNIPYQPNIRSNGQVSVFSLWSHFVDSLDPRNENLSCEYDGSDILVNKFTLTSRLNVFYQLSQGKSIQQLPSSSSSASSIKRMEPELNYSKYHSCNSPTSVRSRSDSESPVDITIPSTTSVNENIITSY